MPVTSGSPTQIATSVDTKAELSGVPVDQFKSGDTGWVQSEFGSAHGPFYALVKVGGPPINGITVLAVFEQPTMRWVSIGGGGGADGPFSRTFYCDPLTTTPAAEQDGSDERPFSTIMAAVTKGITFGGGCAILLTAGDYNESVVIPPGTPLFDNVAIIGEGPESTRIIPPAGQPGFAWAPTGPGSPATKFRIQGVQIQASAGAYAVDLDGTNVVGFFGGGAGVPTFNSDGFVFQDFLIQGLRLVRTGLVQLWDGNVAQQPDLSVVQFAFIRNVLITICKTSYFTFAAGGPAQVFVQHDDPAVTRFASLGLSSGTQILAELVLSGFPLVLILQGSFTQGDVTATATPDATQPFGFFCAGQLGFPGQPTLNTFSTPASPPAAFPRININNAIVWGSIRVTHDAGIDAPVVDFRGTNFMDGSPDSIKVTNGGGAGMFTNLVGATFVGKSLFAGPGAAPALRNRIVYPNFPVSGPAGSDLIPISPPLPPLTRYAINASPSGPTGFLAWADSALHTDANFTLTNTTPNGLDNVDIILSVSATNP